MKWQRVTIVSRLVCLLFGIGGVFATWVLYTASQRAAEPVEPFYLFMCGLGAVMFLAAGIVGRYPDI